MVNANIEGIKEIFKKGITFDWIIFSSGQDYPVKSNRQIEEFLRQNEGKLFIQHVDNSIPSDELWPTRNYDNINYWHLRLYKLRFVFPAKLTLNSFNKYCRSHQTWFRILSLMWSGLILLLPIKVRRKFPEGFKPFRGSALFCLNRDCMEYIHNFIQQEGGLINFFKYVDNPDEMFFQTIILNSKFADSVINNNLYYIDWDNSNPSRPRIFVKIDLERLVGSSKLFARKFDMTKDADILDMLDQKILNDANDCCHVE